jgi:hypothetical protein
MHSDDDRRPPAPSRNALHALGFLLRHGGCLRIGPLARWSGLAPEDLAAAVNELAERCWVEVTWRAPRPHLPHGLPERFREVERITTTRLGRWRYPVTWAE